MNQPSPDSGFSQKLIAWSRKNGRFNLPWQIKVIPYTVWVSEIMLQQTQVNTVIPFFNRFIQRFPQITELAQAREDEVLHYWTGLGYYSRARNLHKTAQYIVNCLNGEFPKDVEKLSSLPGIGRSTAGAIVALAYNKKAPILDGNVKRVLSRVFAVEGYPGLSHVSKQLWELSEKLCPTKDVALYTQAIMDLGATICTRKNPRCTECPFVNQCLARRQDDISRYPGTRPGKKLPVRSSVLIIIQNQGNEILLERRPTRGIWGGLWGFPELPSHEFIDNYLSLFLGLLPEQIISTTELGTHRHTFTHFHLDAARLLVNVNLASCIDYEANDNVSAYDANKSVPTPGVEINRENLLWFHPTSENKIGISAPVSNWLAEKTDG